MSGENQHNSFLTERRWSYKEKNDRKFETKSLFVWDLNQTGSARRLPADENNFLETQNSRSLKTNVWWKLEIKS